MKGKEERRESRNSGNWQWVFGGRKTQKKMGKKKSMRDPDRLEKMEEMGEGEEKQREWRVGPTVGVGGKQKRKKWGTKNMGADLCGSWGEAKKEKNGERKWRRKNMGAVLYGSLGEKKQ